MELLGAGRPEPFSGIVKAPGVEVGHLWPFHHNDAAYLPGAERPGFTRADWNDDSVD
jgi:hypothetical protein